jgi:hypothetical protein
MNINVREVIQRGVRSENTELLPDKICAVTAENWLLEKSLDELEK